MPSRTSDPAVYASMGLSDLEYASIKRQLGREPTRTELGMFAVLWSEHCSYKSSKGALKQFFSYRASSEGKGLENAGVVDIGEGIGIAFKVESHNHPSAVEPYEGAATGVGGIIRDILSMGARPIACLNSLRFGDIADAEGGHDRLLFDRVIQGIGGYGNCIGVPTVAGEVAFERRYKGSPIVNVMCVGEVKLDKIATATARGAGNSVIYLGSATGRDGIHGATFASEALEENGEDKRPNVQIGDPFAGKLLIEATLEALATGAILAIQDMGAAGLTCSTCEMSAKGGVGMSIELDRVPLRDPSMSAYEIMLSESQERMLAVVSKGREEEVIEIFHKWGLPANIIGSVTNDGTITVRMNGEAEARVPARFITDGCPSLELSAREPDNFALAKKFSVTEVPQPKSYDEALIKLLSSPTLASKAWVYEQYDSTVQTRTSLPPGKGDAAVLALRGTSKGIAVKIDGNARWANADPYNGGRLSLVEAARNVACVGARPVGATDCLNFGDPNQPEVYWQFREAVRGMAEAAAELGVPVLSGNVSFYNETEQGEVLPTPTVGVVGVLDDAARRVGSGFPRGRGFVYVISGLDLPAPQHGLGASEYLRVVHGIDDGAPQPPVPASEKSLIELLVGAARRSLVACAHDISEGGLAVAVAEMCAAGDAGCHVLVDAYENYQRSVLRPLLARVAEGKGTASEFVINAVMDAAGRNNPWGFSDRTDARLFGEMPGRVLIGVPVEKARDGAVDELHALATELNLNLYCVGTYDSAQRHVQFIAPSASILRVSLEDVRRAYYESLPALMRRGNSPAWSAVG